MSNGYSYYLLVQLCTVPDVQGTLGTGGCICRGQGFQCREHSITGKHYTDPFAQDSLQPVWYAVPEGSFCMYQTHGHTVMPCISMYQRM